MKKAIIDLRDRKEDVIVLFPENFIAYGKDDDDFYTFKIKGKQGPYDLVSKSWTEFLAKNQMWIPTVYKAFGKTEEDREAFVALGKLRLIWHEWVTALGEPTKDWHYTIKWGMAQQKFYVNNAGGSLVFKEQFHAEKFIECFRELLEKAKILL